MSGNSHIFMVDPGMLPTRTHLRAGFHAGCFGPMRSFGGLADRTTNFATCVQYCTHSTFNEHVQYCTTYRHIPRFVCSATRLVDSPVERTTHGYVTLHLCGLCSVVWLKPLLRGVNVEHGPRTAFVQVASHTRGMRGMPPAS